MNMSVDKMENEKKEDRTYPMNGIRLCIDYIDEKLEGRMYSKMTEETMCFDSIKEMLLEADDLFDQHGYPQRYMEPRSFQKKTETTSSFRYLKPMISDEMILGQGGKHCTLDLFVQSRRKAGWQGIVLEPSGKFVSEFKSELELLKILENKLKRK